MKHTIHSSHQSLKFTSFTSAWLQQMKSDFICSTQRPRERSLQPQAVKSNRQRYSRAKIQHSLYHPALKLFQLSVQTHDIFFPKDYIPLVSFWQLGIIQGFAFTYCSIFPIALDNCELNISQIKQRRDEPNGLFPLPPGAHRLPVLAWYKTW